MNSYWIKIYEHGTHKILFQSGLAQAVIFPPLEPGSNLLPKISFIPVPNHLKIYPFQITIVCKNVSREGPLCGILKYNIIKI